MKTTLASALLALLILSNNLLGQTEEKRRDYLGRLSANPYATDSTSNKFGVYGSPYSSKSINNPFTSFGNAAQSPFVSGIQSPKIISEDGVYLGRVNRNRYDPESIANPFGPYGSPFSPNSIANPLGKYGSPFSPLSVTNPFTLQAPKLYAPTTGSLPIITLPKVGDELNLPKFDLLGNEADEFDLLGNEADEDEEN